MCHLIVKDGLMDIGVMYVIVMFFMRVWQENRNVRMHVIKWENDFILMMQHRSKIEEEK
jgi:hypothetical protein